MNASPVRYVIAFFAAVVVVCALPGCGKRAESAEWWQGEQERLELSQRLELQRFRLTQLSGQEFQSYEGLRRLNAESALTLKLLRERNQALGQEVLDLQNSWAAFREATLRDRRHQAMGLSFDVFTLDSGRKFEGVSVTAIHDAGVTIRHVAGSARLGFNDLNANQRRLFGLEQDLAVAAMAAEKRNAAAYEKWVDHRLVAMEASRAKVSQIAERDEATARKIRATYDAQLLAASSNRALAQPARSVGSRSTSYYYTSYSRYDPYRTYNRYPAPFSYGCSTFTTNQAAVQRLGDEFRRNTSYGPASGPPRSSFADTALPSTP